jgi:hypothetical protein
MTNTDLLTEKYYDIFNKRLNEASWWERIAPYLPFVGGAAKVGAGVYGLDQLLDFGKNIVDKSFQAPKMADKGSERLDAMVAKPGENFGDEAEKRIKALQSDKALWQMSTSKRNTILGREQSMAANINKKRMQSAKAELMSDPDVQAARKKYEDARKAAPKPPSGLTPEQMLQQKSDPTVKAAYDALKAAEAKAMGKAGTARDEYQAARSGYLATRRETSPMATYSKDYSNFTVGQGVGGNPIIVSRTGGYINPNSAEGRLQAEIDAGRMRDLPRTPDGRIRQGKEMPWETEEKLMQAREEALGFNPRGMTEDQIREKMKQLSKEKIDAENARIEKEAEAAAERKHGPRWASPRLPQSETDNAEEIRQGSLGNRGMSGDDYIDELRRRAGLPPLRGGVPPLIAR